VREHRIVRPAPTKASWSDKPEKPSDFLLCASGLKKVYPRRFGFLGAEKEWVTAVADVSFFLRRGERVALVGESGCGKTTTALLLLYLVEPTGGEVLFEGISIYGLSGRQLRRLRPRMQMIFQNPYLSLNPRQRVERMLAEAIRVGQRAKMSRHEIRERSEKLLEAVQLPPDVLGRYPHEFSGGQQQRLAIARALAVLPSLLVMDEAVSSLDVLTQQAILHLLQGLQEQYGLTYLFISHDLRVVSWFCERVLVMYAGAIVEEGPVKQVFSHPAHPYTAFLLQHLQVHPTADLEAGPTGFFQGTWESGCAYRERCPRQKADCSFSRPEMVEKTPGQRVSCWNPL